MKKNIFTVCLCLTLLLSGCTQGENSTIGGSSILPTLTQKLSQAKNGTITPSTTNQANWKNIQGKIKGIYSAKDGKVLVLTDKLSIFDLSNSKIIASTENLAFEQIRVCTLNNGYAVVGELSSRASLTGFGREGTHPQFLTVFYDTNLKKQSEVDITRLVAEREWPTSLESIAVSPNGSQIVFSSIQGGLNLYDCSSKKCSKLIDLSDSEENEKSHLGLSAIEQVGFTNGGKTIAFKAQSFDIPAVLGTESFDTIGSLNIDRSGLTNKKIDGYATKTLTCYDSKLLISENFKTASGHMMVIDSKTGAQKIHKLSNTKEGENIYGSDNGDYFASSIPTSSGWTIRVYDSDTGKLVSEQNISNDGQELYAINDPILFVSDDTNTCVVLLGRKQKAVDTKIVSFTF